MERPRGKDGRLRKAIDDLIKNHLLQASKVSKTRRGQAAWLGVSVKYLERALAEFDMTWETGDPRNNKASKMEKPWTCEILGMRDGGSPGERLHFWSKWLCFFFDASKTAHWETRLRQELAKLPDVYQQELAHKKIRVKTDDGVVIEKRITPSSYGWILI